MTKNAIARVFQGSAAGMALAVGLGLAAPAFAQLPSVPPSGHSIVARATPQQRQAAIQRAVRFVDTYFDFSATGTSPTLSAIAQAGREAGAGSNAYNDTLTLRARLQQTLSGGPLRNLHPDQQAVKAETVLNLLAQYTPALEGTLTNGRHADLRAVLVASRTEHAAWNAIIRPTPTTDNPIFNARNVTGEGTTPPLRARAIVVPPPARLPPAARPTTPRQ